MKTDNSKTLKKLLGGDLMPDGLIEDEAVYADWLSPLESLDESDRLLARILICWRLSLAGQAGNLDAKTAAGDLRRRITQEIRSDCNLRCGLPIKSAYSLFGRQAFTLRQIRESFGRDTYPHFFSNEDVGPLMTFPNPDQPIILPFLIYDLQGIARVFIKNFAEDLRGDPAYEALVDKITNSLGDDSDDPAPSLLDKELQDHVTKKYQNWRNFYSKATYVDVNESWAYGREPAENWAILKFLPDGTRGHEAYKDELEKFNEVTGFLELLRTGRHFDAATFLLTTRVKADRTSRLLRLICWAIPEIGGDCKETLKILEKIVGDDVWWEDPFRIPHQCSALIGIAGAWLKIGDDSAAQASFEHLMELVKCPSLKETHKKHLLDSARRVRLYAALSFFFREDAARALDLIEAYLLLPSVLDNQCSVFPPDDEEPHSAVERPDLLKLLQDDLSPESEADNYGDKD